MAGEIEFVSKVVRKGRTFYLLLPAEVREFHGLREGQLVKVRIIEVKEGENRGGSED